MKDSVYDTSSVFLLHWIRPEEILPRNLPDYLVWQDIRRNALHSIFDEWKIEVIMNSLVANELGSNSKMEELLDVSQTCTP